MAIKEGEESSETFVEFDEALAVIGGSGKFQRKVVLISSLGLFCSYINTVSVSFVLPASQCDLNMDSKDKGYLLSSAFLGIALSCHLWGFLSDTLGRQYILSRCLLADGLLYIIISITPNYSLILFWRFCSGFASCGAVVCLYAYVGEFHQDKSRLKALMVMSLIASSGSSFLPVIAWLIIPIKWSITLYPGLIYKSWRLYYGLHGLPSLICSSVLHFLPESPKFLLAKGETTKALEVLQLIHKENLRMDKKETFMIKNIYLHESENILKVDKNLSKVTSFFILMWNQTIPLFKPPHRFCLALICCTQYLLYLSNGGLFLWLPETANRMANFKKDFNGEPTTYCDVVQYKKQELEKNLTLEELFSLKNHSNLKSEVNRLFAYDDKKMIPLCKDDIDFSVYFHLVIIGVLNVVTLSIFIFLTHFFNKRYIFGFCIISSLLGSICLLAVNIIEIIPVVLNLIIVLSGVAIPMINIVAVDLFPTNLRAMASCLTLMSSRIGTITANALAGSLIDLYCSALLWCYIISFTVCLVLIILLPNKAPYLKELNKTNNI